MSTLPAEPPPPPRLKFVESVLLFVPDIHAAAAWYGALFQTAVHYENPDFAFINAPGLTLGFHPADDKCPGGVGGTTVYWEVEDIAGTVAWLQRLGARLHRGPGTTRFGAGAAMLVDPFGCTIGLNQSSPASRAQIAATRTTLQTPPFR